MKLAVEKVQRDQSLRIKVRRKNIWEASKVKLAKYTESDLYNIMRTILLVNRLLTNVGHIMSFSLYYVER